MDRLVFMDISYLKPLRVDGSNRASFIPKNIECNFANETDKLIFDECPILELTRFQCRIIRDNILEIVRFADTGKL